MAVERIRMGCAECFSECSVIVVKEDGQITRVEGDPQYGISKDIGGTFVCRLGERAVDFIRADWRLKYPLKRVGKRGEGKWKRISWDEAYDYATDRLQEVKEKYGPLSIMAHGPHEWYDRGVFMRNFVFQLGSPQVITYSEICGGAEQLADLVTVGEKFTRYQYGADFLNSKCIMLIATNPACSFPNHWAIILRAKELGTKLIVVDPRYTESAQKADLYLQIKPGTDDYLGMAMLNVMINEELYDKEFVDKWCIGFDKLKERVQQWTPESVEKICEIPADKIREAIRLYATTKPAILDRKIGIAQQPNAFQTMRIFTLLIALSGNIDKPGANILIKSLKGAVTAPEYSVEHRKIYNLPDEVLKKQYGYPDYPMWSGPDWFYQCASYMVGMHALYRGEIKALVSCDSNPVATSPSSQKVVEGYKKLDFCLGMGFTMNPTTIMADIVLPATHWMEEEYLWIDQFTKSFFASKPAIEPLGECRTQLQIFLDLTKLMVKKGYLKKPFLPWSDIHEFYDYRLKDTGFTFKQLQEHTQKHGPVHCDWDYYEYEKRGFKTPSGKIELYSSILEKFGYDPLPYAEESPESHTSTPDLAKEYPHILITGARTLNYFEAHEFHIGSSARKTIPWPQAQMHTKLAQKLGIESGDWCWIGTRHGKIKMKADVTDGIHPNTVSVPFGWWYPERGGPTYGLFECNVNAITSDLPPYDPVTGVPTLKPLLCKVAKCDEQDYGAK